MVGKLRNGLTPPATEIKVTVIWSDQALEDIERLYNFLKLDNPRAAARIVKELRLAPQRLRAMPRLGQRIYEFPVSEIRRMIVGHYELRYEIRSEVIYVLRLWHGREERL